MIKSFPFSRKFEEFKTSLRPLWQTCAGKWLRIKISYRHSIKIFTERKRLFNKLMILTHTVFFKRCVFSKSFFRMLFWLYTYPFYTLCAFFSENYKRKITLCSDAEWKQATKSVRKWDFCFPCSLRSQESIHCKPYYVS